MSDNKNSDDPKNTTVVSSYFNVLGNGLKESIKKTTPSQRFVVSIVILIVLLIVGVMWLGFENPFLVYFALYIIAILALVTIGIEFFVRFSSRKRTDKRNDVVSSMVTPKNNNDSDNNNRRKDKKMKAKEENTIAKQGDFDPQILLQCLETKFRVQDLRRVAFLMGLEWDNVSGENKTTKIISLVEYAQMRGQLGKLNGAMMSTYPNLEC